MITVCTVILDACQEYLPIYFESLAKRTKLINEVLLAKTDSPASLYEEWKIGNITFKKFGIQKEIRYFQSTEHGLGLHECIQRASNEHLLFHDPDVFYYYPVDEFFYNLMEKYQLDIIGISHCTATKFAYTFFPYLSNVLLKKSNLPNEDWLKGEIFDVNLNRWDGKYLIRTTIPKYNHLFPNPNGDYDTGSFLWLWANQQNWKWVSFQTTDIHTYSPKYNRGNVKLNEKLNKEKFLYHATSSTSGNPITLENFKAAWQESNENILPF